MKAYGIPYAVGTLEGIGLIAVLRTPFVCLIVVALMLTACVRPVIVGTQGGHCDRGFTSVATSDELRRMVLYSPDVQYWVEELIQQAGQNLDATLRCSRESGEQTVTYTFQVWTLEDLKNWRSLVPTSDTTKVIETIEAVEIIEVEITKTAPTAVSASPTPRTKGPTLTLIPIPTSLPTPTPTPAPRMCATEWATLQGPEGELYFEWVPKARLCEPHEPTGSVKKQDVPEEVFELFGTPHPWER